MERTTKPGLTIVDRAIERAASAHQGQFRKKSDLPYISHPFSVCILLAELGCGDEVLAAAALHDTVEDTEVTLEELEREFGPRIAALVEGCSEPDRSRSWEERKRHTIESLGTAPIDVRMIVAADKLHNIRCIRAQYDAIGNAVWERCNRGRVDQAWYYRGIVRSLRAGRKNDHLQTLILLLEEEVEGLFGGAGVKAEGSPDAR